MTEDEQSIPEAWKDMRAKNERGYYTSPTKQDVLETLEPGQSPQSRLRHLHPDPVPEVQQEKNMLEAIRAQLAKLLRRKK